MNFRHLSSCGTFAIQTVIDMAQIFLSLSYKVCSTSSPKFLITEPSLLTLGKSAFFSQCLVANDIKYWSVGNLEIRPKTAPKLTSGDWYSTCYHF